MIVNTAGIVRPGPVGHRMDPPGAIFITHLVCRVLLGKLEIWKVRTGSFCREFGGVALKQDQESNILGQYPYGDDGIFLVQLIRLLRR